MARLPRVRPGLRPSGPFIHAGEMAYFEARAAYDDGALVGWGSALRGKWFPSEHRDAERDRRASNTSGEGVGSELYRALLAALPARGEDDRARPSTTPSPSRSPSPARTASR